MSCSKKDSTPKSSDDNSHQIIDGVTINGAAYSTVVIGNKRWTSENYNGPGGVFPNNATSTDFRYGKLYTLAEARAVPLPTGWRLPADTDAMKLVAFGGGTGDPPIATRSIALKFRSATGWYYGVNTNELGFNAFPAGYYTPNRFYSSTGFLDYGRGAHFWCNNTIPNTPETTRTNKMIDLAIEDMVQTPYVTYEYYIDVDTSLTTLMKGLKYSIRFVKDN
ncbi:FISUMP domain-containing protein [Mucilaginibacter ximonensis]|uniref:FISUMP domain-containing protein n=2 Tax=Mucilaginibacter ximonensis TaxID=538021 RepID=A0ABW5YD46_9SPHI